MSMSIQKFFYIGMTLAMLAACSDEPEPQSDIIRPVRFQQLTTFSGDRNQKFTGMTKADEEIELSFKVTGTIISLNVTPGKKIKKGSLIAKLDSSDAGLKLDKQKLSLEKARTQMETASSNFERVRGLYENNNVPLGEYETAKEKFSNANATFESEKRAVDLASRDLGYYELKSPVDGVVLSKSVSINENIQSGQIITVIQSGDALSVEVGMPEQYIAKIKKGQLAKIILPSISNMVFDGLITEVAYNVSSDSSTYPVTVTFNNPTNKMRPGMPATVLFNFKSGNKNAELLVPVHSVAKDDSGNFVYLVVDSGNGLGKVHKVQVTVGRLSDNGFEIINGLKVGDKVITAGVSSLEEGMSVKLLK